MVQKSSAKDAGLNLIVPLELKRRLVKTAAEQGKKVSGLVRQSIEEAASILYEDSFRPLTFQDAVLLLLLQASEFCRLADSSLLSYRNLSQGSPQQLNETLCGHFPICCLAAGLLRYNAKNAVLVNAAPQTSHDAFFVFLRKAR